MLYFGPEVSVTRFKKKLESGNTFPLREMEIEVVKLRLQNKSLEQVGNHFGYTRERIRQIEVAAMAKIYFNIEIPLKKYGEFEVLENNRFKLNKTEFIFGADLDWIDGKDKLILKFIQKSKKSKIDKEHFTEFIRNHFINQNRIRNLFGTETISFDILYKEK